MKKTYSSPIASKVGDIRTLTQGVPGRGLGDGLWERVPDPVS